MTGFTPFRGAHVHPDFVRRVPAPAVDSLSSAQRRTYLETHPDSYTLVTRAPGDGGPDDDREPSHLIEMGAATLHRLLGLGAFVELENDGFFLYEIDHDGHRLTGIAGLVDVADYLEGRVKRHERVDTERAAHLAHHFERVGAQSSAIAMGYRSDDLVRGRLDEILGRSEPRVAFTSGDGAKQRVWPIDDPDDVDFLSHAFGDHDLYIMDGHHRAAAAALFHASAASPASQRMFALLLSDDRLNIEPFHRRVFVPADLALDETLERIATLLDLQPDVAMATNLPDQNGSVGVWCRDRWWQGHLPEPETRDPVSTIDPVRLQRSVIGPLLGIDPSAPDHHLAYVLESTDRRALTATLSPRELLFVLRPVRADEVFAVADAGLDMPPKSTYVTPKPRSGVLLRRYPVETG